VAYLDQLALGDEGTYLALSQSRCLPACGCPDIHPT
jgi:hypothetical protein